MTGVRPMRKAGSSTLVARAARCRRRSRSAGAPIVQGPAGHLDELEAGGAGEAPVRGVGAVGSGAPAGAPARCVCSIVSVCWCSWRSTSSCSRASTRQLGERALAHGREVRERVGAAQVGQVAAMRRAASRTRRRPPRGRAAAAAGRRRGGRATGPRTRRCGRDPTRAGSSAASGRARASRRRGVATSASVARACVAQRVEHVPCRARRRCRLARHPRQSVTSRRS